MPIQHYMRRIHIINDEKLKQILKERAKVFTELGKVNQDIVELDKERTKLGYKMNKLKEKTEPIIEQQNFNLNEFEIITQVYLNEKGEAEVEIVDRIEELKEQIRKKE